MRDKDVNSSVDVHTVPPALLTSDPGSFAQRTILQRKPAIIHQVLNDHNYPQDIVVALRAFEAEIASEPVRALTEDAADVADWLAMWT